DNPLEVRHPAPPSVLKGHQRFTNQEIADLLGWSEPKARNLLYRGLKELRSRLRLLGIEYELDE
ncbi:MAG: hypothetical protein ACRD1T_25575, partial [Acidimicrobiia bacterium]